MPLKKSLIKTIKICGIALAILYPFIVFFALKTHVALRAMAVFLLCVAGISFMRNKNIWVFICVLSLVLGLILFDQDIFLKMYPVVMNISMCAMFALSLRATPLIEQFAQKFRYKLDKASREYARRATLAWAVFMCILAVISTITVFLSDEIWVAFNGFISYVLIACMFGGEYLIRKRYINGK